MRSANDTRLLTWQRVREYAVPPSMIETATVRRLAGDWAGACAAARVDVDLHLRDVARTHGSGTSARLRADLRHLAPDLLRWHFPRVAPDGLLRPGLTVALARYGPPGSAPLHLVARTAPAWADAGQRISLALWSRADGPRGGHPHARPGRRFRFDLHRHLWDARRAGELWQRTRPDLWDARRAGELWQRTRPDLWDAARPGYAVHRWAEEARLLLDADGAAGAVLIRLDDGRRVLFDPGDTNAGYADARSAAGRPLLPDVATHVPPDLELLRAGLVEAERLHPLVAAALAPGIRPTTGRPARRGGPIERTVHCAGARHRIALRDGTLVPLDHDPADLEREAWLVALGGPPMPCLQAIDQVIRHPESLDDVRARLDHGDFAGALTLVEDLLGSSATLRGGALQDELETAALRRVTHGMFRAGMTGFCPPRHPDEVARRHRSRTRPRHAKHC
ncbi:hypothetical protein OHA21_25640 [Actinoplanes sp. NBC_00393]|uniref:hypothetical protein n=1 Tax=Actinoplanes sp. NBC_00393 TaxID=2975953 RepID=UPI002E231D67